MKNMVLDTRVAVKTFRTVSGCLTRALARGNVDTSYADVYNIVIIIYKCPYLFGSYIRFRQMMLKGIPTFKGSILC